MMVPISICATKIKSTGKHCPNKASNRIFADIYLCDKCYESYKNKSNPKMKIFIE